MGPRIGRLLSARTGQPDDPAPDLAARILAQLLPARASPSDVTPTAGGNPQPPAVRQKRGVILRKLSCLHVDHASSMVQVMADLLAATATRMRLEIARNAPARPGDKTRRTHQKELSCRITDFVSTPTTCSPCVNRLS